MSKLLLAFTAFATACAGGPVAAAVLGPHAADCADGSGKPAMLVSVDGLKDRAGRIRIQIYGGDPAHYFDKGTYLDRVDVASPPAGPVTVCMPVAKPGLYAVYVWNDENHNGHKDMSDGIGFSGNPDFSYFDAIFARRPSPAQVQVKVAGVTTVPVVLNYIQGMSVKKLVPVPR